MEAYVPAANLPMLRLAEPPGFKVGPGEEGPSVRKVRLDPARGRVDLTQRRGARKKSMIYLACPETGGKGRVTLVFNHSGDEK